MTIARAISDERAADARSDFDEFTLLRYSHQPFSDRVWELRHNLTAYDATFVALAEALEAPLVTCDARLAAAPGHHAADRAVRRVVGTSDSAAISADRAR